MKTCVRVRTALLPLVPLLALLPVAPGVPAQNLARGQEINAVCAGCHGEFGQGGKKGEYPRLAGQQPAHLVAQLRAFRQRTRVNLPMIPYTQERELSDTDIADVAAYLAAIDLPTDWPQFKPEDDALTRLTLTEKVMIVPRVAGDLAHGRDLYQQECAYCHGKTGRGGGRYPRLVGQYTAYLARQMTAFVQAERPHDEDEAGQGILNTLKPQDLQDVMAYLTSIQNPTPP